MRNFIIVLGIITLLLGGVYVVYKLYLPEVVAQSIVSDNVPAVIVPQPLKKKIEKIKKPVNESAATVVTTMHKSGITMDQIFKAIDEAQEEQAYAMLDELNETEIKDQDQVFNMAKRHFPVNFNVEVFREPFKEKVSMRLIKKGIRYANIYRERDEIDAETAKSIAKKILLQKQEEFNKVVQSQ